ncbi:MAG TPA: sugar phosphate isomerase/epimerase [Anaeromyxobacter sp.]|nr:sugar phosphate isomerase/epimerase [Anaeromyxobacter sp.]
MIIGCFALVEPFSPLERQFQLIREMGFRYADVTDNHDGGALGVEYGFAATASLDDLPGAVRGMAQSNGLTLTSVCAHANLLDPSSPALYGTPQVIKAIRLAHHLGVKQVITAEGEPRTAWGHALTKEQRLFLLEERLQTPIAWAEELGIELLLEPHGMVTDDLGQLTLLLDRLGHEKTLGVNLDTGNSWLGGGDPVAYVKAFGKRIRHVHWKDMPAEMTAQRGKQFGCGMGGIPVGDGVVGIRKVVDALRTAGFDGPTTLEIAGRDAVLKSAERLQAWSQ